ncbi:MAG TPA: aminotransferase class IV [Phycisphaerales bacterium]|nr:aminotransferase class IV [Phycisphaerales bacterium]
MPTCVFLNGKFYGPEGSPPLTETRVSAFDAGFQHAVGLFETMLGGVVKRGIEGPRSHGEETETWVLDLDAHMDRLAGSAKALGLSDQLRTQALGEVILETVRRSSLDRARVRATITGGDLAMLTAAQRAPEADRPRMVDPTVLIVAQPATEYPREMFERGVSVTLAEMRANPLNPLEGHKALNYWARLRDLQIAASKGAAEALVLSITNHVCSGCVSNLLLIKDGSLITPIARGEELDVAGKESAPIPSPVVPGIVRAWAMDRAERLGLRVQRRMVSLQDVLGADEAMLTNSSWGVLPVVRLEANAIGAGAPGKVTLDLRGAWLDRLPRPTDPL